MATNMARKKRRRDRIRLAKSTKLQISTHPGSNRTLKRSARKQLRQEFDRYNYILPWMKDPWYRYRPNENPPASLLRLPTELLQTILLETISPIDLEAWPWDMMKEWASVLRCVSPLVRVRMSYVQQVWKNRKDKVGAGPLAKQKSTWSVENAGVFREAGRGSTPSRIGPELKIKQRKRRKRDRKCWYCEQRHYSVDPICPMARGNPDRWRQLTRKVRTKQQVVAGMLRKGGYQGSKISFED